MEMDLKPRGRPDRILHLAVAAMLAVNMLVIAAWPMTRDTTWRDPLSAMYGSLCHQMPSRSLVFCGEPMPVCARCVGVWAGLTLAAAMKAGGGASWRTSTACCLAAVMLADWCLDRAGLPAAWHFKRTLTGLPGGIGLYLCAMHLAGWAVRRLQGVMKG